jgi:hypothetical protein
MQQACGEAAESQVQDRSREEENEHLCPVTARPRLLIYVASTRTAGQSLDDQYRTNSQALHCATPDRQVRPDRESSKGYAMKAKRAKSCD